MKGFRKLGDPLFSQGLTARLWLGTRMVAGGVTLYTISGTVYDADGITAVAGATVALGALTATSAADGTYTISNVPAGTSGSMTCTKTGYSWTAKTIAAMSGNLTSQNYTNAWWAAGGISAGVVGAYRAIGAANQAASYVNLKNPSTNDLTLTGGTMTWDINSGLKSTGGVLGTGITYGSDYTLIVRVAGCTGNSRGPFAGNFKIFMAPKTAGGAVAYGDPYTEQAGAGIENGTLAVIGTTAYVDTTALPQALGYNGTAAELILMAYNGAASFWGAGFLSAAVVLNTALTAPQLVTLRTALMALTSNP